MIGQLAGTHVRRIKAWLKLRLAAAQTWFAQNLMSYGPAELERALRQVGVRPGDSLMLHSGFSERHGFRGSIADLTNALIRSVGPDGHLLMVSLPYRSSTLEYLKRGKPFDARHTPSMMGIVSEMFRRRPGVLRSLHPTHPVLVHGPQAAWFVQGHEDCIHPCGTGTPFDKLSQRDGIVAFLNVEFANFTFFHHLEHLVHAELPFALYTDQAFEVTVRDGTGASRTVRTHAFSAEAIRRRRFDVFERELRRRGLIARLRIGATCIEAVRVRSAIACVQEMSRAGLYFYDLAPAQETGRPDAIRDARP